MVRIRKLQHIGGPIASLQQHHVSVNKTKHHSNHHLIIGIQHYSQQIEVRTREETLVSLWKKGTKIIIIANNAYFQH